jgi:hypothetical protein
VRGRADGARGPSDAGAADRVTWEGALVSVQPRIRLNRSFDERYHDYQGYLIVVQGRVGDEMREGLVGIGKGAQARLGFRVGQMIRGYGRPVEDPRREIAELYKAGGLAVVEDASREASGPPPWLGVPPELLVYRERGHRRLAARTYNSKCVSCIWGCKMVVEMIIDHWNPHVRRYRTETFCYGPKSCALYKAGPTRKVPGRKGMVYEEQDWVDEEATAHRLEDE